MESKRNKGEKKMSQRQKREVEVIESRKRTGRNKKGKGKKY